MLPPQPGEVYVLMRFPQAELTIRAVYEGRAAGTLNVAGVGVVGSLRVPFASLASDWTLKPRSG